MVGPWPPRSSRPAWAGRPLDDPGEGQHAEIAREMLGGSRITLRLNGVRYFDKPPTALLADRRLLPPWSGPPRAPRAWPRCWVRCSAVAGTRLLGVRFLGAPRGAAGRARVALLRALRRVRAVRAAGDPVPGRDRLGLHRVVGSAAPAGGPRAWTSRRLRGAGDGRAREGSAGAGGPLVAIGIAAVAGGAAVAGAWVAAAARLAPSWSSSASAGTRWQR